MKLNISKLENNIQDILTILQKKKKFKITDKGIVLQYIKTEDNKIEAKFADNNLIIKAPHIPAFLKGLAQYIIKGKNFKLKIEFEKIGMMIDNSRNGVTNVEYTKKIIEDMAFMGHNTLYLYIEDTYKLDSEPYFGYLRGAYSKEELKELDNRT